MHKAGMTNRELQLMMLVAPMAAQFVILPIWGRAADRMGKRPLLVVATLGLVPVGVGWCFVGHESAWVGYVLAAVGMVLWTGVEVANLNMTMEMSGSAGGTAYHAVNTAIVNAAACLGGLAWGGIAQWLKDWHWTPGPGWKTFTSFDVLFVASGVLRLAAVMIFLPHIREAGAKSTGATARFVVGSLWGGWWKVVRRPVEWIVRGTR
jgi:MFS family permease